MEPGSQVTYRKAGKEYLATVLHDLGNGMLDLTVPLPDGDGQNPHRINSVPYWKYKAPTVAFLNETPPRIEYQDAIRDNSWREM